MASDPARIRFGEYELDIAAGSLREDGVELDLPDESIQILGVLVERPGEPVSRNELQRRLWPNSAMEEFDRELEGSLARLRGELKDPEDRPRYIEALPEGGFRFISPCEPLLLDSDSPTMPRARPPGPNAADWLIGAHRGPYEIVGVLGEGGMGKVYRARDTKLNRSVALKILPEQFAADVERLARFKREAQVLAALSHPNIAGIYGVETNAIVMELVEGQTLAERIELGPLPVEKAVAVAQQLTAALEAAHEKGIIHRDLKPANIKLTPEGTVKVLDFGLAKPIDDPLPEHDSVSPTVTFEQTREGVLLGTAAYMSPEQARAMAADRRADVWAFGAVMYEMLSGRRPFTGESMTDVLAAVVGAEPDWSALPRKTPAPVVRLLQRCLTKDRRQRLQAIGEARIVLDGPMTPATPEEPSASRRWVWIALLLGSAAAAAGYSYSAWRNAYQPPTFKRLTFKMGGIHSAVLSPDGRTVVYRATWDDTPTRYYVLAVGQTQPHALDLGAASKLYSLTNDGTLAFGTGPYAKQTLAEVSIQGGQPHELLTNVLAADWNPNANSFAVMRRAGKKDRLEYPIGRVLFETDISDFHFNPIRFSPDGTRIAFVYMRGLQANLAVADLNGAVKDLGLLGRDGSWTPGPFAWSPNSREVWIRSYTGGEAGVVLAFGLNGSKRVLVRFPGTVDLLAVARDGKALLQVNKGHGGVIALGPGQAKERDLSWEEDNGYPRISADGNWVVYTSAGEGGGSVPSVILCKTDGSRQIKLGDGVAMGGISPDGKWVNIRPGVNGRREVLMPTGPGEAVDINLPNGIGAAGVAYWLPDGKSYIVNGNVRGRDGRYWYWQPSTGLLRPLSQEFENSRPTALKPDGTELVIRFDEGYRSVSLPSGESKPFPGFIDGDRVMVWSADGKYIYFQPRSTSGDNSFSVWRFDVATRTRTFWKLITPSKNVDTIGGLHLTPNGCCYTYEYERTLSDLYLAEGLR